MADTNFVNGVTRTNAEWFQDVNDLVYKFDVTLNYTAGTLGKHLVEDGPSVADIPWLVDPTKDATYNTPKLQTAINWCITNGKSIKLPKGFIRINQTLIIQDAANISIMGPSPQGGLNNAGFIWDGANGGTVMLVNRTRDSEFGRFTILQGTGTIGIGVDLDNASPVVSPNLSGNQRWFDVFVDGADVGWWISRTATANNELHRFYRCRARCLRSAAIIPNSSAWRISQSQAKFIHFETCTSDFSTIGMDIQGGSAQLYNHNFSHNDIDVFLGSSVADAISLFSPQSETAGRFLDDSGATSSTVPFTVFGGRLSPDAVNADTFYIRQRRPGPTTFIGTQISQGIWAATPRAQIGGGAGATLTFDGCNLPNDSFVTTTGSLFEWEMKNCRYRDSGGIVRALWKKVSAVEPVTFAVAKINGTAGTLTYAKGIASITKNAVGNYTFTFAETQLSSNYAPTPVVGVAGNFKASTLNHGTGSFDVQVSDNAGTLTDVANLTVTVVR